MPRDLTTEHQHQAALFEWATWAQQKYPELENLYAVPNGAWTKNKGTAIKLKKEGLKAGVPDVCLAWPNGIYHGLYIELKKPGGRATAKQNDWLNRLTLAGYRATICFGYVQAINEITEYIG